MGRDDLIEQAYAAYNRQDSDLLLTLVGDGVDWPDGSTRLRGKRELQAYWMRQWATTRTHDEVLSICMRSPDHFVVQISQVVRTPTGVVISTGMFEHRYRFENGLIGRLDVRQL